MSAQKLKVKGDHIPVPDFLRPLIARLFDPYPQYGSGPVEPPAGTDVWVNPGFSRKREAWENAKRWAAEGHYVVCYIPVESSTDLGFDVQKTEQAGKCERLTFHTRPLSERMEATASNIDSFGSIEGYCENVLFGASSIRAWAEEVKKLEASSTAPAPSQSALAAKLREEGMTYEALGESLEADQYPNSDDHEDDLFIDVEDALKIFAALESPSVSLKESVSQEEREKTCEEIGRDLKNFVADSKSLHTLQLVIDGYANGLLSKPELAEGAK